MILILLIIFLSSNLTLGLYSSTLYVKHFFNLFIPEPFSSCLYVGVELAYLLIIGMRMTIITINVAF